MRKLLLLAFIIISPLLRRGAGGEAFAQTNVYHPFPDSGAHWREGAWWVAGSPPCGVHDDYSLFMAGDTIIGAYTYQKILKSGFIGAPPCQPPGYYYYNHYMGSIRQDKALKKVFYYPQGTPNEQLLYDFNLNIGDTLAVSYNHGNENYVTGIDSVLVGGNYHKAFLLSPLSGPPNPWDSTYVLIEGIGSKFGLYNSMRTFVSAGGALFCYSHNSGNYPSGNMCTFLTGQDETIGTREQIEVFPNPTTGICKIESTEKFQYSIYNVFGMEIIYSDDLSQSVTLDLSDQPKGIYFFRGISEDKMFSRKIILQ